MSIRSAAPVILLAPDSFKESLSAIEVCQALERGLRAAIPEATFVQVPMADGGEGTVDSLVAATGGAAYTAQVTGPLGTQVQAKYGLLGDGETAVIEMASASGLELVAPQDRNVRTATTYGTGELIRACLDRGIGRLIIGLGGSATNDGGAGMAQALGARLLDVDDRELAPGGAALARLARIDVSGLDPRLGDLSIEVACDVTNPLLGPQGASAVYGPQKGASVEEVVELDAALAVWATTVARDLGREVADVPGAGAAGGLGAGLLALTTAVLRPGIEIVIDRCGLRSRVREANLVVTGEGRMDRQTLFGKTPFGVAKVAAEAGKPVIAIAGSLGDGVEELYDHFEAVLPVVGRVAPLAQVLADAAGNVERTSYAVGRLLRLTI